MSELNASNLRKEHGNEGPDLVGLTELTSPYFMVPPSGTTAERPQNPQPGTLRFNTDIGSLEYFKGDTLNWESIDRYSPNLNGGARGLYWCGTTPGTAELNIIEYITISTLGNSTDFGDATDAVRQDGALASSTRGVHFGGYDGSGGINIIDYVTISSTGNAVDFGDTTAVKTGGPAGLSNQTRGIIAGGETSPSNVDVIEYITIAQTGNAVDFGNLSNNRQAPGGGGNSIRGVIGGGIVPETVDTIDYITIATTGNSSDFGDLTQARRNIARGQSSNSTRHIFYAGQATPTVVNTIDYITIASLGNAVDFGDSPTVVESSGGCASSTRAVFSGGHQSDPTIVDTISYIEILTTGNTTDFGNLTAVRSNQPGCSNAHGGL